MQRPVIVTIFGILNIVFGVLGLMGMVATLVMFTFMDASANPALKVMNDNPNYLAWLKLNIPLGLLSCIAVIVAGIGLLKLKEWARKLSLAYAVYALVIGIIGVGLNYLWVTRPMLEDASHQHGPAAIGAIFGAIGGGVGGLLGLVYPVFLFVMLTRPNVVAIFRPAAPPPLPR
jgi:hypothetical protein